MRYWHVLKTSLTYSRNQGILDTTGNFEDTFAVTAVDYTTIVVKGDTFKGVFDSQGVR